jgi:hypothetical protein
VSTYDQSLADEAAARANEGEKMAALGGRWAILKSMAWDLRLRDRMREVYVWFAYEMLCTVEVGLSEE